MLALSIAYRHALPEIDMGTADLLPTGAGGHPALPNAAGQAPSILTIAAIYAEASSGGWDLAESMAVYNGAPPPPLPADFRHPAEFTVKMRSTAQRFENLGAFHNAVKTFRAALGAPIGCVEALGKRFTDLHSDLAANNFPNADQGPETRDLYPSGGGAACGAAFLARTGSTTTTQHWVLFDGRPFDNLRCVKRAQSYPSVAAFLSAMQTLRNGSPVAFRHAYEQATHFADVPASW